MKSGRSDSTSADDHQGRRRCEPTTGEILARGVRPYDQDVPARRSAPSLGPRGARARPRAGCAEPSGSAAPGSSIADRRRSSRARTCQNLVGTSLSRASRPGARRARHGHDGERRQHAAFGEQWLGAGRESGPGASSPSERASAAASSWAISSSAGPRGAAGEIGHIGDPPAPGQERVRRVLRPRPRLPCGSYGCLERLVSATAVAAARGSGPHRRPTGAGGPGRAAGGPSARLLHQIGRDLGAGLSTVVTLFDVDFFVIGGGFGAAVDLLEEGALEVLEERRYGTRPARIAPATLGSDARIGAARLTSGWPDRRPRRARGGRAQGGARALASPRGHVSAQTDRLAPAPRSSSAIVGERGVRRTRWRAPPTSRTRSCSSARGGSSSSCRDSTEAAAAIKVLRREGLVVVPRGAGTGLSGGARPIAGGAILGTARMRASSRSTPRIATRASRPGWSTCT